MKKIIAALIITAVSTTSALAHGGGLNSQGCHNNHSNGTYHCHNNYTPSYGADVGDVIAGVVVLGLLAGIANEMDKASQKKKKKHRHVKVRTEVVQVQEFLNRVDDANLTVDGQYGPKTKQAIINYYSHYPVSFDGRFDKHDLEVMKHIYKPQRHGVVVRKVHTPTVNRIVEVETVAPKSNVEKLRLCISASNGSKLAKRQIAKFGITCN